MSLPNSHPPYCKFGAKEIQSWKSSTEGVIRFLFCIADSGAPLRIGSRVCMEVCKRWQRYQSAACKRLDVVENAVQACLFKRKNGGVEITGSGRSFVAHARAGVPDGDSTSRTAPCLKARPSRLRHLRPPLLGALRIMDRSRADRSEKG